MLKRFALLMVVLMLLTVTFGTVYGDDKAVQKDKAANCALHKDGKCPADCCPKQTECKEKGTTVCKEKQQANKSTCKESACKSSCPAQSACKSAENSKK